MKHLIKLIGLLAFGTAAIMIAVSSEAKAGAAYYLMVNVANAKKPAKSEPVVVKGKKPAEKKAAPKKDAGKIKPLDPNRKVPTLKKKYRKED